MLDVTGLVVIPKDPQLKITTTEKGHYFNFNVVSQGSDKKTHRYQANLWVDPKDIDAWTEKISPGNVFIIHHANWRMQEYEGGKYPIPCLMLYAKSFKKLSRAQWDYDDDTK